MIDLHALEGYLKTKGCKCSLMSDACGSDEYIVVFGRQHSTAIIYATYNNYVLETRTNMYINPRYGSIEGYLRGEEII